MDLRQIRNLMKEFEDSKIHKLEIIDKDFSIRLEKEDNSFSNSSNLPSSSFTESVQVKEEGKEEILIEENYLVKAPLVGTYYQAPSPDSEPFVRINQKVVKGDVLFIIEAMKVMNEITSPVNGTIVNINVKDTSMVEFDQVVLEIKE
ncbi:MAG: acetyl-CoA carboxylase, biotin carboxyl carrier protein [Candidatus Izimaplasma sp.]|nr:acetyl-CoA carboxylase, biotin carboxyl carrier protein [Candidatus Izimaplasma bacterium]